MLIETAVAKTYLSPNPHMDQYYHELENRDYEGIKAVGEV